MKDSLRRARPAMGIAHSASLATRLAYGVPLAALLGTTFGTTGTASAQEATDYVIEQFEPLPMQGVNILNIGRSEVIPHLAPSFGLVFHFADDPYQVVFEGDEDRIHQRIVDYTSD